MIHKSVQTCESVLMRKIEQIWIGAADRERLERLVRDRNTPQKVVWRAQIVLSASEGMTAEAIAATVAKSLLTVRRWRQRYTAEGVEGLLKDATRPSRHPGSTWSNASSPKSPENASGVASSKALPSYGPLSWNI